MYHLVPPVKKIKYLEKFLHLSWDVNVLDHLIVTSAPKEILYYQDNNLLHDAYELFITPSDVRIHFKTPEGRFYALQTLRQIIVQRTENRLQCVHVSDQATFHNRAILLDVSRDRMPRMSTLFQLIDFWASLKINQLHLYIEHTFCFSQHKKVWKHASAFSHGDIQKIDNYCMQRNIELIPTLNSFGHMERWLKFPEYQHLAETPHGYTDKEGIFHTHASTLSPVVKEVIPFLDSLFEEFLPNFKSSRCNFGADEPFELGIGRSKQLCERKGIGTVYVEFLNTIHKLLEKRGKESLCYGDIIVKYPEHIHKLPAHMSVLDWGYEANHPFDKEAALFEQSRIPFYLCAGTSAWNSIGGRWHNARENILNAGTQADHHGADGLIVCEWGDNGHMQQYPIAFPGYLLGAASAWNPHAAHSVEMESALALFMFSKEKSAKTLANVLLDMGSLCDTLPSLSNATILGVLPLLYRNDYKVKHFHTASLHFYIQELPKFIHRDFKLVKEKIHDLENKLHQTATDHNSSLYRQEMLFTLSLLDHSASLCDKLIYEKGLRKVSMIRKKECSKLAKHMETLLFEYKKLWQQRSRPGGLQDSILHLQTLYEAYTLPLK